MTSFIAIRRQTYGATGITYCNSGARRSFWNSALRWGIGSSLSRCCMNTPHALVQRMGRGGQTRDGATRGAGARTGTDTAHAHSAVRTALDCHMFASNQVDDDHHPSKSSDKRPLGDSQGGANRHVCVFSPLVELKPPHSVAASSHLDVALKPDRAVCP
jgi:hypothetical protein